MATNAHVHQLLTHCQVRSELGEKSYVAPGEDDDFLMAGCEQGGTLTLEHREQEDN